MTSQTGAEIMTTPHDKDAAEREAFEQQFAKGWSTERFTDDEGDEIYVEDWLQGAWIAFRELTARAALSPASSTGQEAVWHDICERSAGAVLNGKKGLIILEDDLVRIGSLFAAPAQQASADLSTPPTHAPDMSKTVAEIDACTGDTAQDVRADVRASDIGDRYAHRLALMLECALLDPTGTWNDGHKLLDEYRAEHERTYPSPPTFMGEPLILTPSGSNNGDAAIAGSEG